jgi:hypothetical protein
MEPGFDGMKADPGITIVWHGLMDMSKGGFPMGEYRFSGQGRPQLITIVMVIRP